MFKFSHKMQLSPVDPLGDGLSDEIKAEQAEPEAIHLEEPVDDEEFSSYWDQVTDSIEE
jgi:hypothetical protein